MFFIKHANTRSMLKVLADAITSHSIVPFYGCKGSGKSWLLGYLATDFWRQERGITAGVPRVVYAELWEPQTSGGKLSTPSARVTFTEIVLGLAQISRRYDSPFVHNTKLWYRKDRKESEDKQFASLFAFVRDEVGRLGVDALLIDNAHLMDFFTLQKLMKVRQVKNHELGLIFCAPVERQGQINDNLDSLVGTVIDKLEIEQKVELEPTPADETMGTVLMTLLAQHKVGFSPDLDRPTIAAMRRMFWDETQGDWIAIAVRERRMKTILGTYKGKVRYIDRDVWEQIMGKPLPEYRSVAGLPTT